MAALHRSCAVLLALAVASAAVCVAVGAPGCGPATPDAQPPPPLPPAAVASAPAPAEPPPLGRLPRDVRPTGYTLELRVDPARPRFEGTARIEIQLDRPRDVLWLHGKDLAVREVVVAEGAKPGVGATWEQVSPSGVAAVRLPAPVGPGPVTLTVRYDAPFGRNDEGAYVIERGKDRYVFTQLEATYARRAFPCFDEPAFKVPFHVVLDVPRGLAAVSNAREVSRAASAQDAAWDRVDFAPTPPLPSYLVAFAVGPLDVVAAPPIAPNAVRARPLPLRGLAIRGRGVELAYALAHTGELVAMLEGYFGIAFPYEKLDLIAVPEKGGAMENAGAITCNEGEILLDEKRAPVEQRYAFAAYIGHEIAHQWFGDLVTMPWWDDIWLNEAFATWMEPRIVAAVRPDLHAEVRALDSVHEAMNADSLVSARKIRQEITDDHDIDSAFDSITYDKGGGVLSMFERWVGPAKFQKGIHAYLEAHRFGTATADDLLAALDAAAGREVSGPFRSFLDQPGLPFVDASLSCEGPPKLRLAQSRFLPVGSKGGAPRAWKIPVCARYLDGKEIREACTLLDAATGELPLPAAACPAWVMPNADATGYYRWALTPADGKRLARGMSALTERERMSFAVSLTANFSRGAAPVGDVLEALAPLASDPSYAVAGAPMGLLSAFGRWLEGDPLHARVETYGAALYAPVFRALGWQAKKGEPDRSNLRQNVLAFLLSTVRDPALRKDAAARGRAYIGVDARGKRVARALSAVSPDLAGTALQIAAEEGGAPVFDALVEALASEQDDIERRRLLVAIGSAVAPDLAARARGLELDPRVHENEVTRILQAQALHLATREAAWAFFTQNLDKLLARLPPASTGRLTSMGVGYCDQARRDETEKLLGPRVAALESGPHDLAGALEEMSLCIARRAAQEPGARAFFASRKH